MGKPVCGDLVMQRPKRGGTFQGDQALGPRRMATRIERRAGAPFRRTTFPRPSALREPQGRCRIRERREAALAMPQ
jgi:hypothetical protein